jgi:hypothetical protein
MLHTLTKRCMSVVIFACVTDFAACTMRCCIAAVHESLELSGKQDVRSPDKLMNNGRQA